MEWRKVRRYDLKRPVVLTVTSGGQMTPPPDQTATMRLDNLHRNCPMCDGWGRVPADSTPDAHAQQAEEIARLKRVIAMEAQVYRRVSAELELLSTNCDRLTQALRELLEANQGVWSHSEQGRAYIAKCVAALSGGAVSTPKE